MAAPLTLHTLPPPPPSDPPPSKTTPNTKTPNSIQQLLTHCASLSQLKQIQARVTRLGFSSDALSVGELVAFAAANECGSLNYARQLFDEIPQPTQFTFNSIIRAYTNKNLPLEALLFYSEVIERGLSPDEFTLPSLFKSRSNLIEGKQLHCHALKFGFASDIYVQNTLMLMYSNCGCFGSAEKVFDRMPVRTVVSWATMITAYANWGRFGVAFKIFWGMESEGVEPNEVALMNVLVACARARDLTAANRIHEWIDRRMGFSLVIATALLDVYCKCGCVSLARRLFDEMPGRNLISWNVMIKGHVEDSDYEEAFALFRQMQDGGVRPDKVTMASLLLACSYLGALELGKWLHAFIMKERVELDVVLGTALVDMYAKCGCVDCASKVFHEMPERDVMTWTSMIGGFAMCGQGKKALELFSKMQSNGMKPDAITFVGLLTACSHAGLVDEGYLHFNSMSRVYGIEPSVEHYGCMVDLLGRAGKIEKAEKFIKNMPMKPDYFVLGGLLSACRIHGNLEVAQRIAQQLLELFPSNPGAYVLLSNIYGSVQKWDEVKRTRELMSKRNVKKLPGCSMIEVNGVIHEFVMGDESHPQSPEIYTMLEDIVHRLKDEGYVPDKSQVLIDMDEEEKENALCRQ